MKIRFKNDSLLKCVFTFLFTAFSVLNQLTCPEKNHIYCSVCRGKKVFTQPEPIGQFNKVLIFFAFKSSVFLLISRISGSFTLQPMLYFNAASHDV